MARYVPKTYNNGRILRVIIGAVTTVALSIVILFLILFFIFSQYVVDGQLDIPLLIEEGAQEPPPPSEEAQAVDEENQPVGPLLPDD